MKRRRRILSDEEARLWAGVARTAVPLKGKHAPDLLEEALVPPERPEPGGRAGALAPPAAAGPVAAPQRRLPAISPIERAVRRKLSRGRLAIEARIDLHDKTQAVAHYALLGFLRQAQAEGLRHVLVITGRGASFGSRGILRRVVPHWFATPEFRALVSGFEPAERHHGGEGAFYVRVRRRQ
ncbi:Smr/MutS family protein [Consotaella salsifontis]|uniref:DNA-nicking endonuclease, Smr domain n=1 Tax=Consotaella salsifontis TaxID=1365950 RepID=A0A1T4T594_9HYPH|nr:Smr/MutS family protein [Consotaella salsifontis]SKA35431.1 DNA-nicking endonuclease, Smr domain [Consotaella salsifontis]